MKITILATILFFLCGAFAAPFEIKMSNEGSFFTKLQVGYHKKSSRDRATMLFFIGYGDRMSNHLALFEELNSKGIRVISFNYPQHGDSTGSIWKWSIREMAEMTDNMLALAKAPSSQPLILAGWSTGGTIMARILQQWQELVPRKFKVSGAVLLAPGIPIIGHINGGYVLTEETITRGRMPHPPSPSDGHNLFTSDLLAESKLAAQKLVKSRKIPVVVVSAEKDVYSDSPAIADWVRWNRKSGRPVYGVECRGAFHGLEFEPNGIASTVIGLVVDLSEIMSQKSRQMVLKQVKATARKESSICPPY